MANALIILARQSDVVEKTPDATEVWCLRCENKCWLSREAQALLGADVKLTCLCYPCFMEEDLSPPS